MLSEFVYKNITDSLNREFSNKVVTEISYGELLITIKKKDELVRVCKFLKNGVSGSFCFEQLIDLCGVDYLHYGLDDRVLDEYEDSFLRVEQNKDIHKERFAVVYHLLSLKYNCRVRLRVFVGDCNPSIATVSKVWSVADWYERESFDLFGIEFYGHSNLCRILTDYGFRDFPLRKDFLLVGETEVFYDNELQSINYRKTSIKLRRIIPKVVNFKRKIT